MFSTQITKNLSRHYSKADVYFNTFYPKTILLKSAASYMILSTLFNRPI